MNESLVKYLAGILDADGCLSFVFREASNNRGYYLGLGLKLDSSIAVDKLGFIDTLPNLTGMGYISYSGDKRQFKSWQIGKRSELEMILPRLIKHMIIKAKHWQWLLDMWREIREGNKVISAIDRTTLAESSKESRKNNCGPLRHKNHPTWAWLAGYLDGDGWYSYRSNMSGKYKQWSIHVGAVAHVYDICVLEFLQNAFGGTIQPHGQSDNIFKWYRSLGYQNKSFALNFLPKLAKHARLKRKKIDAIIHHHRQRLSVPGTNKTFCKLDNCNSPSHGNGLCSKHYQAERKKCKRQSDKVE